MSSKKLPSFQFYPGDWMKDPNLRRCSRAARGMWADMICLMFECEDRGMLSTGGVPWSDQEIAAATGGDISEGLQCISELSLKGVARRNKSGAIYSKRIVRDEEQRQKNLGYQQKHRESRHASVMPLSDPSSSSVSSSEDPPIFSKNEKTGVGSRRATRARSPSNCDEDFLQELQTKQAYESLDVRHVYAKMLVWCEAKCKRPSRMRLINWLNREDPPMNGTGNGHSHPEETDGERYLRTVRSRGQ